MDEPRSRSRKIKVWGKDVLTAFDALEDITGRGSFLVLSAPWHTGSPPGPHTHVWALAEVRGTCSGGLKWHVRSGRHSEHVEPSRCMQIHAQVKRMSDGSHVIWDLECRQRRQTSLGDGKVKRMSGC